MSYFFIPGRLKDLAYEELNQVVKTLEVDGKLINNGQFFTLETNEQLDVIQGLFERLGGFVKFGTVSSTTLEGSIDTLAEGYAKTTFGVSYYAEDEIEHSSYKKLVNTIKKTLKAHGVKANFILPKKGQVLSTAQIKFNDLMEIGNFELNVLNKETVGITKGIQDIDNFSFREFDKPFIDEKMGVLPLKLCRIMVNLSGVKLEEAFWDPFCGSGTLLMEGLEMGHDVIGSDISSQAVSNTKNNIFWLGENYDLEERAFNIFKGDITFLDKSKIKRLQNTEFNTVVFEPYMGPAQKKKMEVKKANHLLRETQKLVAAVLEKMTRMKKEHVTIVFVFPSYLTNKGWITLRNNEIVSKKWNIEEFSNGRKSLQWSRPSSIITRNIYKVSY